MQQDPQDDLLSQVTSLPPCNDIKKSLTLARRYPLTLILSPNGGEGRVPAIRPPDIVLAGAVRQPDEHSGGD